MNLKLFGHLVQHSVKVHVSGLKGCEFKSHKGAFFQSLNFKVVENRTNAPSFDVVKIDFRLTTPAT